jgi:hypothetical protein
LPFFDALHRRIGTEPLTGFEWLTADRLVQRTTFGSEATVTANFGSNTPAEVAPGCVRVHWIASREDATFCPARVH